MESAAYFQNLNDLPEQVLHPNIAGGDEPMSEYPSYIKRDRSALNESGKRIE